MKFQSFCDEKRVIVENALNRKYAWHDGEQWQSSPCTKAESVEIALDAFDELVYEAYQILHHSRAMEYIMNTHGLMFGKDFTMEEYLQALDETADVLGYDENDEDSEDDEEENKPVIRVVRPEE